MIARKPLTNIAGSTGRSLGDAASASVARGGSARRTERPGPRWWHGILASLFCALAAAPARAQEPEPAEQATESRTPVEACLAAHLNGQELRQKSKLLESREQFRQCARQECPSAIARDCVEWFGQFERQIPSITVRVTADGMGRTDARVVLDGVPVDNLNGKAIELNPGEHLVRVELPPFAPYETTLLISEGDQFRVLEAQFLSPTKPSLSSAPEPTPAEPVMERPVPVLSYVFGVVTVAAAANGAGWALSSRSLRQELEKACAPGCLPGSVDVLKQRALIADISFGVSIASLITTVTLYALRPEVPVESDSGVAFGLDVLPGGAVGSVSVSAF